MSITFTDGCPGGGPCAVCGGEAETRFGCCFDCATEGERKAAHRSILQHLAVGLGRVLRGRRDFGTRLEFIWAWERLTKTGDYAPGGEFDRMYLKPKG